MPGDKPEIVNQLLKYDKTLSYTEQDIVSKLSDPKNHDIVLAFFKTLKSKNENDNTLVQTDRTTLKNTCSGAVSNLLYNLRCEYEKSPDPAKLKTACQLISLFAQLSDSGDNAFNINYLLITKDGYVLEISDVNAKRFVRVQDGKKVSYLALINEGLLPEYISANWHVDKHKFREGDWFSKPNVAQVEYVSKQASNAVVTVVKPIEVNKKMPLVSESSGEKDVKKVITKQVKEAEITKQVKEAEITLKSFYKMSPEYAISPIGGEVAVESDDHKIRVIRQGNLAHGFKLTAPDGVGMGKDNCGKYVFGIVNDGRIQTTNGRRKRNIIPNRSQVLNYFMWKISKGSTPEQLISILKPNQKIELRQDLDALVKKNDWKPLPYSTVLAQDISTSYNNTKKTITNIGSSIYNNVFGKGKEAGSPGSARPSLIVNRKNGHGHHGTTKKIETTVATNTIVNKKTPAKKDDSINTNTFGL